MMNPTRRDILKTGSAALAGLALPGHAAFAQASKKADAVTGPKPTLVVIYLRGGADPLNAIVPYGDPRYRKLRPTIAVQKVRRINDYFGFHPAMGELADLYDAGKLCAIVNTGSTHPTRSHFDAQDFMERAAPGTKEVTEGWLNRYLTATHVDAARDAELRAVAMQATLPRSLRGDFAVLAMPGEGAESTLKRYEAMYDCESNREAERLNGKDKTEAVEAIEPGEAMRRRIAEAGHESIEKLRALNQAAASAGRSGRGYPGGRLGQQLREVAQLIKGGRGLEVAAIDYSGWDHHARQGGDAGTMATMLGTLSKGLQAFARDLGPALEHTVVLTMTEFGRTVAENGNGGTDHGRAGFMLALGGPVAGGKLYGGWKGLEKNALVGGRDLKVQVDFRNVFAETLQGMFGFRADQHDFFPGYQSNERELGFLRSR